MAVPGEIVHASTRTAAIEFIRRMANSARGSLAAAPSGAVARAGGLNVKLVEMARAQADDFARFLHHPVVWGDDMICYGRASVGARLINEVGGRGLGPTEDSLTAAVAILRAPPSATHWSFHAGIAVKPQGGPVHIIDPYTRSGLIPIDKWAKTYGRTGAEIEIVSPFAGSRVNNSTTTAGTWSWIEQALTKTWKQADNYDVEVMRARA